MGAILQILVILVVVLYTVALIFIFFFSLTQAALVYQYLFHKKKICTNPPSLPPFSSLPTVTVQLPVYNEKYVVERLIEHIARLDYPKHKLEIQVLDDSTDETKQLIEKKVAQLQGIVNIKLLHRVNRTGYKAGALKEGLATATGDVIAIFDADFLPPENFLLTTVPYFTNESTGMVQTKWGWLNQKQSLLTRIQAFALDAHFSIEQVGRSNSNVFINFNGTAGLWRKSCILDAGNWQADTLTEDLDLSYRAQLKGWKFIYLEHISSPSELPPVMSAIKTQQYRWNKGGAETARKHLGHIIYSKKPFYVKWHGVMHLLTSGVFLCVFTGAVLSIPLLLIRHFYPAFAGLFSLANYCFISFALLGLMYLVTVTRQYKNPGKGLMVFLFTMPVFVSLSMGLSLHNALAVLEGYAGKKTPFIRTPKFNITGPGRKIIKNNYVREGWSRMTIAETGMAAYFALGLVIAFQLNDYIFFLLHLMLVAGYSAVVYYTIKGGKAS